MDSSNIKVELHDGDLPVEQITNAWYDQFRLSNYGAIITFVGVVRDEDGIDGLSFDIYEPILNNNNNNNNSNNNNNNNNNNDIVNINNNYDNI